MTGLKPITFFLKLTTALAGIGEIANIPNPKPQKFWTDRSVVWILIFLEKFEKISSADFIAKNLKKISSVEFIDADCIEKKFALLISLKKISTVDFIEKNFSNPKPQFPRTDQSVHTSFPTRLGYVEQNGSQLGRESMFANVEIGCPGGEVCCRNN